MKDENKPPISRDVIKNKRLKPKRKKTKVNDNIVLKKRISKTP